MKSKVKCNACSKVVDRDSTVGSRLAFSGARYCFSTECIAKRDATETRLGDLGKAAQ